MKHTDAVVALEMLIRQTGINPALVKADSTLQVVVLSGRREQVEALQAVLAELDVPRRSHSRCCQGTWCLTSISSMSIGAYRDAIESPGVRRPNAGRPAKCRG